MNEDEAVSAVIGVILMVAITVAIAATVYVYVSGMIGGGSQATPSLAMNVDNVNNKFTITSSGVEVAWSDVKIKTDTTCNLSVNGGSAVAFTAGTYQESTTAFATLTGNVVAGTYFSITGVTTGTVEVTFLYEPTNAVMSTCKVII